MQAIIKWTDGMQFIGESGSGHSIVLDGAPEVGGQNTGMRPMEMLLLSMGGCSAMDVIFILRKARQNVRDCNIVIEGDRVDTVPKVFNKIHMQYNITGHDLDPKQVERAVNLSANKYCSVTLMLKKATKVSHDFTVTQVERK